MSADTISASPLQWPVGWKRTPAHQRTRAKFSTKRGPGQWGSDRLSIAAGVDRVRAELDRMGIRESSVVISTNLALRLDGLPRSGQPEPTDPGVAVYWRDSRVDGWPQRCMAIDRYDRVADNLAAVAATLDAMRAIERHGGASILDRAFTGFAALPGPAALDWRSELEIGHSATLADAERAYRTLRSMHHPDRGGNAEDFQRVQRAWEQAQRELGDGR